MKNWEKRRFDFSMNSLILTIFLMVVWFSTQTLALKCKKDSECPENHCCVAANRFVGICKPKFGYKDVCQPEIKLITLFTGSTVFSSCGCRQGLTCSHVSRRKRKNRRKLKRRNRRKIRYKCFFVPTEAPEIAEEVHIFNS